MNIRTAWLVYSLLRIAFFAVPFAALMLIGWKWWFAAIVATLVAVSLSVIFLAKPREAAAKGVYDWRNRDRTADDIAEDDAIEAAEGGATEGAGEQGAGDGAEPRDEAEVTGENRSGSVTPGPAA